MSLPSPRRGQRGPALDPAVTQRILETTAGLLAELGVAKFRLMDVAERAAVGIGAIYRRWPSKDELIIASVKWAVTDVDEEITDDVNGLRRLLEIMARFARFGFPKLLPGLIFAAQHDPEVDRAFRAWFNPGIAAAQRAVRASAAGPLDDYVADLVAEIGPALLLHRAVITREAIDDYTMNRIVDDILLPILDAHTHSTARTEGSDPAGARSTCCRDIPEGRPA